MPNGIALIAKPQGFTSFDVVARLRRILKTKKIGHAGTLDPMATGLLIIGVGSGTKLLQFLIGVDKQYLATIRLGAITETDDAEGEIIGSRDASGITPEQIDLQIARLTGEISQVPSSVSAIKVDGKRAYDLVREGKTVELLARDITIRRFERTSEVRVLDNYLDFDVLVDCSSGTYIRALARDIGARLEVGGHLTALSRTKVGDYSLDSACQLDGEILVTDLELAAAEIYPSVALTLEQERDLRFGRQIDLSGDFRVSGVSPKGDLVAILESAGLKYRSLVVFPAVQDA
ncbi:tRNA pseudouridine(55) synthase TruB [Candidatus Aquiluna sp. UB-MaderosW2red]|uniref:tRNA pseudouridine(55) synthase TruB n=1 Tax=Candidatus Aquiluna sp. UB-MaderosW2red TaxID=1855377 RepID=UPI000875E6C8|nr:tRNA pseudouridine(55) synthase TruB [Candidatus Aquiluna sp. UB-MaderosW2red]SCX13570.1 tRNA pseudouridine55 synthase [Candidatus Aquiluna sp. UB-MaderosW2red]